MLLFVDPESVPSIAARQFTSFDEHRHCYSIELQLVLYDLCDRTRFIFHTLRPWGVMQYQRKNQTPNRENYSHSTRMYLYKFPLANDTAL